MAAVQGLTVHELGFPIIDVAILHTKAIRLRLLCHDWDDQPPSITLLIPDGSPRGRLRLHRAREVNCVFCSRLQTLEAWALIWPECDWSREDAAA